MIKYRKGFRAEPILEQISKHRRINSDGSLALPNFTIRDEWKSFLVSAIEAPDATDAALEQAIGISIDRCTDLNTGSFLNAVRQNIRMLQSSNSKKYKVVFPIWGGAELLPKSMRRDGVALNCRVSTQTPFLRTVLSQREQQRIAPDVEHDLPNYDHPELPLTVATLLAVSAADAYEKADAQLGVELGVISAISSRGQSIIPQTPRTPVATTLIAPQVSVHHLDGSLATETFWYDPWSSRTKYKRPDASKIIELKARVDRIRMAVRRLPWRKTAEEILRRHYRAFRNTDPKLAFFECWQMLEVFGGDHQTNYEKLTRRAAAFFDQHELQNQIGHHLAFRRNQFSHGRPIQVQDDEQLVFALRQLITPMLKHILLNPYHFESLEELWEFADLPDDRNRRDRQAYLLAQAGKFRRES